MKTLLSLLFVSFVFANGVLAQEEKINTEKHEALFSTGSKITGWYVGIENGFSEIDGNFTYMPGFGFGMMINRNFHLGLMGKSFSWHETYLKYDDLFQEPCYLVGGYGGLYFDANIKANKILHFSFPLTIGAGGASYMTQAEHPELEEDGEIDNNRQTLATSPFFILEPGVNVELNITGFMKAYSGLSYRWTSGMNLQNTQDHAFDGFSLNVGLRFGKF